MSNTNETIQSATITDQADNKTARERLAEKMAPAYEALGIVASTKTGKFLFAMACDADTSFNWNYDKSATFSGKRPTKSSQKTKYYEGISLGQRNAYVSALAAMCAEASEGKAGIDLCRRIINMEIDAMSQRTYEQREAAPITNLCSRALDL